MIGARNSGVAFGWAATRPSGGIVVLTVRRSRAEVIKFIPKISMAASDATRLGPKGAYRKAYRKGWRVIRIKVMAAFQ